MLLTRKTSGAAAGASESHFIQSLRRGMAQALPTMDRRTFLRRSGLGVGAGLAATQLSLVKRAEAAEGDGKVAIGNTKIEVRRTVCTHCSVGCAVDAVVENGVWVRQEPVFDSPINLGAHCAKGASVREHGHGEHRLRYPMKLVNGKYQRISWDTAYEEITAKLMQLRKESGPDSVYWIGSSKHNNEQSYLLRKFVSFWGSNNCDHQARICHSTTVAGVANTWGYGAMTNSYNDMQNSKVALYIGSNAAEAHPVSMLHMLHAKETGCKMIVVDPRFTRTAAKADQYVRIRSGTDIPFLFGLLYHIFKNGWEDQAYIDARVYGMDEVKADILAKWSPDKVEEACGVDEATMYSVAKTMHENRPGTLVWCMGQTQHSIGNAMVRASCIVQLALGNVGKSGGGANIFRGHDNVQGATDVGPNPDSLPGYYGLAEGSWKHFANTWGVDYEWIKGRYASPAMMTKPGITVSRWIDGVLENPDLIDQDTNLRAVFYWGHAPNSQTRGLEMKRAMDKLDLLVVVDPYPSATAAMAAMPGKAEDLNPNRAVYLLPAATQFETNGSCTASNRSLQWREKVIDPLWESRTDHMIMHQLAEKLGFGKELSKNYKMQKVKGMDEPVVEDILREINASVWTIGYTGQSPERLKAHMRNMHVFDVKTLRAKGGKDAETGYDLTGDYFGLPWPCWGNPSLKHPGTANLYDTSLHVMDGGGNFRANFGVERNGVNLLAADGSHSKGADLTTGYPEFDHVLLKKLGWWEDLTPEEQKAAEGKNWKTDPSGGIIRVTMKVHGCHPFGNARARAVVWNFPDAIPQHREPIYGTRPDLVAKYPTHNDLKTFWRLPTLYTSLQQKNVAEKLYEKFPIILTSGRLVEYEGGGEETRSNPWLAELQQESFVELNPKAAADRGIRNGDRVWVLTPTGARLNVQALVTERVGPDTAFMPFHFSGHWQGVDMLASYPEGAAPIVRGEAVNTGTTYGYDSVTMMQETKTTICNIEKA
ncbi:formate dehydrogenase subunit alpha [Bordetella bronchiseptica]|uniref:formate dehydrogenase subunit alpha n=1 Tax=Bordetella bronchiseptica TaxID=518 RepID=UPI00045B6101|nr:formate dehydrogenase subunit alpha [Bordetella bronchiseptica]KDD58841.1 molybdopterin oxidoreductase [Bordetella bronchiseptica OSU553]AWQ06004.1 formate dehydrogenase [Bordetella bronchiseptica]KAK50868.1 molybdopterin oxidoreductase [Bordetella bronchiseptica OSU054]KDB78512.1 molybdopterin oxidoreductase [Bordetella bronchiseptica CA90 BB1334]KDC65596.1 molybdopterin oxidoreductase [Bordetella bronchiseptica MBORD591]